MYRKQIKSSFRQAKKKLTEYKNKFFLTLVQRASNLENTGGRTKNKIKQKICAANRQVYLNKI
jgi:hypothetical protein